MTAHATIVAGLPTLRVADPGWAMQGGGRISVLSSDPASPGLPVSGTIPGVGRSMAISATVSASGASWRCSTSKIMVALFTPAASASFSGRTCTSSSCMAINWPTPSANTRSMPTQRSRTRTLAALSKIAAKYAPALNC